MLEHGLDLDNPFVEAAAAMIVCGVVWWLWFEMMRGIDS